MKIAIDMTNFFMQNPNDLEKEEALSFLKAKAEKKTFIKKTSSPDMTGFTVMLILEVENNSPLTATYYQQGKNY